MPSTATRAASEITYCVTVGLSEVGRVPGAKSKQPPARTLLERLRHREADVLRFLTNTTPPSRRHPTRPNATCGPRKPSRRSAVGSA
jgi:hypothetical protein